MSKLLGKFSINKKLGFLLLVFFIGEGLSAGAGMYEMRISLLQEREQQVKYITETVLTAFQGLYDRSQRGEISEEEAQAEAKSIIKAIRYGNNDYVMVYDHDYNTVMHPVKESLNGKNLGNLQDVDGVYIVRELADGARTNGKGTLHYKWPKAGSDEPIEKISYYHNFEPWGWAIATGVYLDEVNATFQAEVIHELQFILGIMVVTILVVFFIAKDISLGIRHLLAAMKNLSSGDTTQTTPELGRRDEVGQMADAVEYFRSQMIENAEMAERQRVEEAKQAERAELIQQLAQRFDHGVNTALNSVSAAARQLDATANSMSATAAQASSQVSAVASASEQTSSNVQTVASASEELTASLHEVGKQVSASAEIANQASEKVTSTHATVQTLSETTDRISQATDLISEIADQTNMLALNATIEAARAGEAGKGFAVVASEVKELAVQTGNATEEIGTHVRDIQKVTRDTVHAIDDVHKIIKEMNQIASAVASAVEEQTAATADIAQNIEQAAVGTQEVNNNIVEVNQAANDTGTASKEVLSASNQLSDQSDSLKDIVQDFLRDVKSA